MQIYKRKRVGVVGLSVEGKNCVKFFADQGAEVYCFDRRLREDLRETIVELSPSVAQFQLGPTYLDDLSNIDLLVVAPGIHSQTPQLLSAQKTEIEITSLTKLFFKHCKGSIIGITGTKGKGTTSTLVAEMLRKDGKNVYLGGNVGTPLLTDVVKIQPLDWVVYELSSFQLEGLTQSPHIAVVLKITQDHLSNFDKLASNFHSTRQDYIDAKKPIVRFQNTKDVAIFNADDETSRSFASLTSGSVKYFSRSSMNADAYVEGKNVYMKIDGKSKLVCTSDEVQLRGVHNLENIAAASLASRAAGVGIDAISKAAKLFKGLPFRLELIRTVDGVSYFDDSFSTVPETTIAAVEAFNQPKILILGGSEKRSDFTQMGRIIAEHCVPAVIVIGQMTERIVTALVNASYSGKIITGLKSMSAIVKKSKSLAQRGSVVILSPACASFDMFNNYKERGYQFNHEVALL